MPKNRTSRTMMATRAAGKRTSMQRQAPWYVPVSIEGQLLFKPNRQAKKIQKAKARRGDTSHG